MPDNKATAIFDADDSKLLEAAKEVDEHLKELQERFEKLKETALGVFVLDKAPEYIKQLWEGIQAAAEAGAHFHDLSANTGIAVDQLVILEEEFRAAGKAADDISPVFGEMQKSLAEGTKNDLIADLGVDLEELAKKTPIEQFHILGKAIGELKSPTDRANAAMDIFGKEGKTLISLFKENGFGDAAERVGEQAQILGEDAALFADAGTKLGLAGLKTQGFFVGLADTIVPTLLPLLDRFEKFDAAKAGQGTGNFLNAFTQNESPTSVILNSLLVSAAEFIGFIIDGLASAAVSLGGLLLGVADTFISVIDEKIAALIRQLSTVPIIGRGATVAADALDSMAAAAHQSANVGQGMMGWVHTGAMDKVIETLNDNLGNLIDESLGEANRKHGEALARHPQEAAEINPPDLGMYHPNVSHLASIGGAFGQVQSGGDPLIEANNIAREHTAILRQIATNTEPSSTKHTPPRHPE